MAKDAFPTTFFYHTNSFSAQLSSFWSSHVWGSRGYVLSMWESFYQKVEILKGWPLSAGSGNYFTLSLTVIPQLLHSARINSLDGHFASDHWFRSFVGRIDHTMISVERKITLKGQQTQNAASEYRDLWVFVSEWPSFIAGGTPSLRARGVLPSQGLAITGAFATCQAKLLQGVYAPQSHVIACVPHTPPWALRGCVPMACVPPGLRERSRPQYLS